MNVEAIVVAAGKGTRMGANINKVYLPLFGRPVLAYSLELLQKSLSVSRIIIVVALGEEEKAQEIVTQYGITKASHIVLGGASRYESVNNALSLVDSQADLIAVHDGARPLLDSGDLERVISAASLGDGAILAYPLNDSIKRVDKYCISESVDRFGLWGAMTPQVFLPSILIKAYEMGNAQATDDSQLVEALGAKVAIVEGSKDNMKITTPMDLTIAELILQARREKS